MKSALDYLIVGHITQDMQTDGRFAPGGTVYYSSRTAQMLGQKAGIVTSINSKVDLSEFKNIEIVSKKSPYNTVFQNQYTPNGRIQFIHNRAYDITFDDIPESWQNTPVIHLGPIAAEVDGKMVTMLKNSFVGLTPQGWLRKWDDSGHVSFSDWENAVNVLPHVDAVVLSIEDVIGDWSFIDRWKKLAKVLVVTLGAQGAVIYFDNQQIRLPAPEVKEIDPTGAGDVFAAAFFIRLFKTKDPVAAGKFAISIASSSVEDHGLKGVKYKNPDSLLVE